MRKGILFVGKSCVAACIGVVLIWSHVAMATDWFVAADAREGNGTRQKPFRDPYMALRVAEPGDVIHLGAGIYYGRYDRSSWVVERPGITIRGGYNRDFSKRTPWQTPSVLAVFHDYEGAWESNILCGRGDHTGLVLDGIAFDAGGRNMYGDKPLSGLRPVATGDGAIASFQSPGVVIRNCIFANSASGGVELQGEGSQFENNVVVNILGTDLLSLRESSAGNSKSIVVKSNIFAFSHDDGEPPVGKGGNKGIGVRVHCPALIQENVFLACANYGIRLDTKADRVGIDRNVFWASSYDAIAKKAAGDEADITEKNMEELEDVGLKSAKGNTVADPGLSGFKPAWLDAFTRYELLNYAHPPREAIAALRSAAGLAPFTAPPAGDAPKPQPADPLSDPKAAPKVVDNPDAGAFAPYFEIADCAALRVRVADRGARPANLTVELAAETKPAVTPIYQPIGWDAFVNGDPSLANKHIELRAGLAGEINNFMLSDASRENFIGFGIYYPGKGTIEDTFQVYAKRNTLTELQYREGEKYNSNRDVETAYLMRGTCRLDTRGAHQKATIVLDSIVPAPVLVPPAAKRAPGHDWFVRAGATGGDGSHEMPFRDPFQALDKAEGGDVIHVAGGDYFGKLRSGKWQIPVRNLTLLGGYDAGFATRDPWKNPTRLVLSEQTKKKGTHDGTFLESGDVSDGLVLDGFVFDGSTANTYLPGGALDVSSSAVKIMVDLRGGPGEISVRNCVFVNASGNAITIRSAAGVFENNVVVNTSGWSVAIDGEGKGPWIIRHNTILFASDWTPNAGTGVSSAAGTLLMVRGRGNVAIDGNVLGFSDNYGIRCTLAHNTVALDNNAFVANLYCQLCDTQYLYAHTANWDRRVVADADYASIHGNTLDGLTLPIDKTFADQSLARLFTLPSQYSADDWKRIAGAAGASVVPPQAASATPATAPATAKPAAKKEASLDDLMADLNRLKTEAPAKPADAPTGPPYCSVYDWHKALDLAGDTPSSAGARRLKLDVAFGGGASAAAKQYAHVTGVQIDAGRDQFNAKLIELEATGARSTNADNVFSADNPKSDWDGYSIIVAIPNGETRTQVSVIVKKDTNASKLMDRAAARDTLRFRGTAKILGDHEMCIVVDSVERVDQ